MVNERNPFIDCPDCIVDRHKLRGVMLDFFPAERLRVNIILAAYDAGIVEEIRRVSRLDAISQGRMRKILVEEFGLREDNAAWAVSYWMETYGAKVLGKAIDSVEAPVASPAKQTAPSAPYTQPPSVRQHQQAQRTAPIAGSVSISSMEENEKLPKDRVVLYPADNLQLGITNFRAAVIKDFESDGICWFNINGEYEGKTKKYLIIVVMVYNANNELIGTCFDEQIDEKFNGRKTFSASLKVPNDEYISKVEVRLIQDPTFWN